MFTFFSIGGAFTANSISKPFQSLLSSTVEILFIISLLGYVVGFANTPIIQRKFEIILQASGFLFFLTSYELIKYYQVTFLKCFTKFRSIPQEIFGDNYMFPIEATVQDVLFEMNKAFFLPTAIVLAYTLLISPYVQLIWETQDNYILSYWYTCSSSTSSFYSLSFLCIYVDNYWKYLALNVVQFVITGTAFHFYFLSLALYVTCIKILEIIAQKLVCMVAVISTKMDYHSRMLVERENDSSWRSNEMQINELELREDLIRIIKCHQYLQR